MLILEPVAFHSVNTLRSLCIIAIRDLLISYVQSLPASSKATLQDALFVISPFDALPSHCVQELIRLLAESKQLDMTLLSVLLHAHLTSLDITPLILNSKQLFRPKLFHLITARCTELLHLTLGVSSKLMGGKQTLRDLISNNSVLRTLNISNFKPTNDVISEISSMRYLTTLDLSNSYLSDQGIQLLTSQDNPLPDLTSLNVSGTQITSRGVQLLLSSFSSLRDLDLSDLDLMVPLLNLPPHPLSSLVLLNSDIRSDSLCALLLAVPQLQRLEFYPCSSFSIDKDWLCDVLPVLSSLTHFSTYMSSLQVKNLCFAKHLVHLSLPSTHSPISAPLLCSHFPSLQLLNLDDCVVADEAICTGIASSFSHLVALSLAGTSFSLSDRAAREGQMLKFIGSFDNMERVDLSRTDTLSRTLLDLLLGTNKLRLSRIKLHSCHRLDRDVIEFLTRLAHACKHQCCVDLSYCLGINRSDLLGLRESFECAEPRLQHGLAVEWV